MLILNYNSWFVRKFLGYGAYSPLPNTICELGRAILLRSFLWLFTGSLIGIAIAMYATAIYGYFVVLFTDTTVADFFNFDKEEITWTNFSLAGFWVFNGFFACVAALIGFKAYNEYREQKSVNAEIKPSPVTEFVKGVWARIHDKTCTMIEWKNDPKTLREESRKKDYE